MANGPGLLNRGQRLLVNGRLAVGRGFERKDRAYRLAGFVGHGDEVGGVGLKAGERGTVIVTVHVLDGADRGLLQVVAVSAVVQIEVRALLGGPGDLGRVGVGTPAWAFQWRSGR